MIPVPKTKLSVVFVKSKHRAVHTEAFLWNSQKQRREQNPLCDTAPGTGPRPKTQACIGKKNRRYRVGNFEVIWKRKGKKITKQLIRVSHESLCAAVVLTQSTTRAQNVGTPH